MASIPEYEKLWLQFESLGPRVLERFKVTALLLKDEQVPAKVKLIPPIAVGAAIWVLRNKNILPQFGDLDNAAFAGAILWGGMGVFEFLSPSNEVAKAWKEVREEARERQEKVDPYKKGIPAKPVYTEPAKEPTKEPTADPGWKIKE